VEDKNNSEMNLGKQPSEDYCLGIKRGKEMASHNREHERHDGIMWELKRIQAFRRCVLNNDNLKTACYFVIAIAMVALVVLKAWL
jgi:hypothetical protein